MANDFALAELQKLQLALAAAKLKEQSYLEKEQTYLEKEQSYLEKEQSYLEKEQSYREKEQSYLKKIERLESETSWMAEQLRALKRAQFGRKSERWETQEQLVMQFNEVEVEAAKPLPEDDAEEQTQTEGHSKETEVRGHKRKARGHRKPLPEHLPREIVKIELPADQLTTPSGERLIIIGWEKSEKLKYQPSNVTVVETHRAKYGLASGDYQKTAPPAPSVIPKGIATNELLAGIIVAKFADGLPLYRLEDIFNRNKIELTRGTMGRWLVAVKDQAVPIRNCLNDRLMNSEALACDETQVQVLKEVGREPSDKSWMFVRTNPADKERIAVFDYFAHRNRHNVKTLIADYKGRFLCDGLNIYNDVKSENVNRFGCNMHARRKFEEAAKIGAKEGKGIASLVMDKYKLIYDHEELLAGLSPMEKEARRKTFQLPIFKEIKELVEDKRAKVPDKSKLGIAIGYFLSQYEDLTRYVGDGSMPPDNGEVERVIRKFAIGRNNWLFSDTLEGAETSALLYSLVITAKLNKLNPYEAILNVLNGLPTAQTIEDYERLTQFLLSPQVPT